MGRRDKIFEQLKGCNKIIISDIAVDYILSCETKVASKIIRDIRLLNDYGLKLGTDYIHRITESDYKLWELITDFGKNHFRTLFFMIVDGKYLLANTFQKSTGKVPVKEIRKAEKIYEDYLKESNSN